MADCQRNNKQSNSRIKMDPQEYDRALHITDKELKLMRRPEWEEKEKAKEITLQWEDDWDDDVNDDFSLQLKNELENNSSAEKK